MTENEAMKAIEHDLEWHSKELQPKYKEVLRYAIQALSEIQQYRAIGTVEEFNALKEKNVEKKPIMATNMMLKNRDFICPNCEIKMPLKFKYCNHCGQKLDWQ